MRTPTAAPEQPGRHRRPSTPRRGPRLRTVVELAVVLLVLTAVGTSSTASGAGQPGLVHFTAVGDFGMTGNTANVLDAMKAQSPDMTMTVGDLSYAATGSEQAFCDQITQSPGAVGLTAYLSGGVTNAPVTVRMSALSGQPTA